MKRLVGCFVTLMALGVTLPVSGEVAKVEAPTGEELWARWGAVLPLPTDAALAPPEDCPVAQVVDGVVADASGLVFVLHSGHWHCEHQGLDWDQYAAAFSVIDASGAAPVLVGTTPALHPWLGERDVTMWSAGLDWFWLAPAVRGLVVTAGGTISGSGVSTSYTGSIFAGVGPQAPRLLHSYAAGQFGKSGMGNASGESVELRASRPTGRSGALLSLGVTGWSMIDGDDQPGTYSYSYFRFDAPRLALTPLLALPAGAQLRAVAR